jgi:hypothetical protein
VLCPWSGDGAVQLPGVPRVTEERRGTRVSYCVATHAAVTVEGRSGSDQLLPARGGESNARHCVPDVVIWEPW